jgi:iron complex transport system substrate-binding protein
MKKAILIGISGIIVSVILLTAPALASAGYSKTYGNANEDNVLDMRDVTYIKLVIFGKKPATTFADANYDGKISMLDVGQAKLIILGKEKKLTLVDQVDRTVTVPRPVERVVTLLPPVTRMMIGLGEADKIVGMGSLDHRYVEGGPSMGFGPKWDEVVGELKGLPNVGTLYEPNQELILSLKPDVVIPYAGKASIADIWDEFQKDTGIPVVGYRGSKGPIDETFEQIELMGRVLGKEKRAEELISYFKEELDKVIEVTSEISDSEKPRVYFPWGSVITKPNICYEAIELAGGIQVSKNCDFPFAGPSMPDVSKEQIIEWNPDIFLVMRSSTEPTLTVEDVLSDPDLQTINAVKNRKVYYAPGAIHLVGADHPRVITEVFIMAKHFHPEKFEDFDLEKEGNELFERFYGVEGLWTEIGGNLGFI